MLFRRKGLLLRDHTSEIDRLLQEPKTTSKSKQMEEFKYQVIGEKRDNPAAEDGSKRIWEDF